MDPKDHVDQEAQVDQKDQVDQEAQRVYGPCRRMVLSRPTALAPISIDLSAPGAGRGPRSEPQSAREKLATKLTRAIGKVGST